MVVCLSPYKSPERLLGLRKGRLGTRLFTSTPCNGTSQVEGLAPPLGPVWLRMSRLLESGHSEHLGDSLTGLQDGSSPLNCFVYLT